MKIKLQSVVLFVVVILALVIKLGILVNAEEEKINAEEPKLLSATATIYSTADKTKQLGSVVFVQRDGKLNILAEVKGITPGKHGVHIHEKGSCEETGNAAGSHFNPHHTPHGFLPKDGEQAAHVGDMGNIEAGADGSGTLQIDLPEVYLEGEKNNVLGLTVILHEKEDDFGQPTGNAGGRIGCGIIEIQP